MKRHSYGFAIREAKEVQNRSGMRRSPRSSFAPKHGHLLVDFVWARVHLRGGGGGVNQVQLFSGTLFRVCLPSLLADFPPTKTC